MKNHTKLTAFERDQLSIWHAQGVSNKECAKRLRRNPSTIGRELRRNGFHERGKSYYSAIYAQSQANVRTFRVAHSKHPLKNPWVFAYVTDHLRCGWSPDQIAGRLEKNHVHDPSWHITAETIYRWIYQKEQLKDGWYEYLRRKQKRRKKRIGRRVHRSQIPDRVSIHLRDELVNHRLEFGHWEGDSLEGKRHKGGIHTEVERVSRLILAQKVKSTKSEATIRVQLKMFGCLPLESRKSTTLDNGRENHLHFGLRKIGMKTYFADPYSAWQRGTNEHGNWHLRYYFPKGTDFEEITEEELREVVEEINNRPRKILNYSTAKEVFNKLSGRGVAIGS